MITPRRINGAIACLGLALLLPAAAVEAAPGRMQVEEPASAGPQPPIEPERDLKAWKAKRNAGLTNDQKAALKARQETMKDMVALIQQKRRAIQAAKPKDREVLAQELHSLILEKSMSDRGERGRGFSDERKDGVRESRGGETESVDLDASLRIREAQKAQEAKSRQLLQKEELLRQQAEILRMQEERRKIIEEKLKALEQKSKSDD